MKPFITIALALTVAITQNHGVIDADIAPPKPTEVKGLIIYYAKQYEVSAPKMEKIISCESGFNPLAHKLVPTGSHRENSWGISQINLFAHPEVTVAQATDKDFAVEYLAKHLALKDVNWTCNR